MRRLVLLALLLLVVPAHAATPVDSAYWWVGQQTGAAPAPPQVPAGGLYVAGSPAGATAVSAVRVPVGATAMTLTVAQSTVVDSLSVDAYVTTTSWKPGDNQTWATRPTPGAAKTHGVLQPDGKTLRFDVSALDRTSACSLVLVPGAGTSGAATFDAAFAKLTDSAFTFATPVVPPPPPGSSPAPVAVPAAPITPVLPAGPVGLVPLPHSQPVVVPTVVPTPQQVVVQQPAARTSPTGRSGNATAALAILLAVAAFFLGWRTRAALFDPTPRTSIYDLPPAADA